MKQYLLPALLLIFTGFSQIVAQSAEITDLLGNQIDPDNDLVELSGSALESGASYIRLRRSSLIIERSDPVQDQLTSHQEGKKFLKDYELLGSLLDPNGHRFDIAKFQAMDGKPYISLTAWSKYESGPEKKQVEYVDPYDLSAEEVNLEGIDEKRKLWVKFSNDHDPDALVNATYMESGYYLSSGRIRSGRPAIIEAYQYMNRPNWKIQLFPEHVVPVHADLIYEVGRYESTGQGSYMLIWVKDNEGKWMIMLDFNF